MEEKETTTCFTVIFPQNSSKGGRDKIKTVIKTVLSTEIKTMIETVLAIKPLE